MNNYSLSTIFLIVYFTLVAIGAAGLWTAPAWLIVIIAAGVAISLLVRK